MLSHEILQSWIDKSKSCLFFCVFHIWLWYLCNSNNSSTTTGKIIRQSRLEGEVMTENKVEILSIVELWTSKRDGKYNIFFFYIFTIHIQVAKFRSNWSIVERCYLRQNIMKLILLLPLLDSSNSQVVFECTRISSFASSTCTYIVLLCENSHFYNLFIASASCSSSLYN